MLTVDDDRPTLSQVPTQRLNFEPQRKIPRLSNSVSVRLFPEEIPSSQEEINMQIAAGEVQTLRRRLSTAETKQKELKNVFEQKIASMERVHSEQIQGLQSMISRLTTKLSFKTEDDLQAQLVDTANRPPVRSTSFTMSTAAAARNAAFPESVSPAGFPDVQQDSRSDSPSKPSTRQSSSTAISSTPLSTTASSSLASTSEGTVSSTSTSTASSAASSLSLSSSIQSAAAESASDNNNNFTLGPRVQPISSESILRSILRKQISTALLQTLLESDIELPLKALQTFRTFFPTISVDPRILRANELFIQVWAAVRDDILPPHAMLPILEFFAVNAPDDSVLQVESLRAILVLLQCSSDSRALCVASLRPDEALSKSNASSASFIQQQSASNDKSCGSNRSANRYRHHPDFPGRQRIFIASQSTATAGCVDDQPADPATTAGQLQSREELMPSELLPHFLDHFEEYFHRAPVLVLLIDIFRAVLDDCPVSLLPRFRPCLSLFQFATQKHSVSPDISLRAIDIMQQLLPCAELDWNATNLGFLNAADPLVALRLRHRISRLAASSIVFDGPSPANLERHFHIATRLILILASQLDAVRTLSLQTTKPSSSALLLLTELSHLLIFLCDADISARLDVSIKLPFVHAIHRLLQSGQHHESLAELSDSLQNIFTQFLYHDDRAES